MNGPPDARTVSPADVAPAVFAALELTEDGWRCTDDGLSALERLLRAADDAGHFLECAAEMGPLIGFIAQHEKSEQAVARLVQLGEVFRPQIEAVSTDSREQVRDQQAQASKWLGADHKKARHVAAPKEGLSLAQLAPGGTMRDPRAAMGRATDKKKKPR